MMSKKVYIETYGCQMNVADTEVIFSLLEKHGYEHGDDAVYNDLRALIARGEAAEGAKRAVKSIQSPVIRRPFFIVDAAKVGFFPKK